MNGSDADKLAFYLLKKVNKAIRDCCLIDEGDRVAVAVSGGKDSLSLLRLLRARQRSALETYELVALHVQDQRDEATALDGQDERLENLEGWVQQEGVEVHLLELAIGEEEPRPLGCFRCSWHRRKTLFRAAHALGCRKLALGHHADDLAQTALLNLFHHGRLETKKARRAFFGGEVVVIRPLIHVPEKDLVRFARACGFPVSAGCCTQAADSQRQKMRDLLRAVQRDTPRARVNLLRAVERCRDVAGGLEEQAPDLPCSAESASAPS